MEEKKPLKIKFKTAVIIIVTAVVLLGIGANVYASVNGYGNIFFLIKYLVTGEKTEITGKDELLSDRDITISYESITVTKDIKLQIRNLQISDKESKLVLVISENQKNEDTPLSYKVYNANNKLICEQNSTKYNAPTVYAEELILKELNNKDKIINLEVYNAKNIKLTKIEINIETREISVEGEKEAVEKISEIKLKEFLGYVSAYENSTKTDEEKIDFAMGMLNSNGLQDITAGYLENINNILEKSGYEKFPENFKGTENIKIENYENHKHAKIIGNIKSIKPNKVLEIKDISYCGGIYTVKFNYAFIKEDGTDVNYNDLNIKEATVEFELNTNKDYSEFKVIKFEAKEKTETSEETTNFKNIVLDGSYAIPNSDIGWIFTKDGKAQVDSNIEIMQGTYKTIKENYVEIHYTIKKVFESSSTENISRIDRYEHLIIGDDNSIYTENENGEKYYKIERYGEAVWEEISENNERDMIEQLVPSGFAGSSLHLVELNTNKEVYVITFDGNVYSENNIKSRELIAKNVESISKNNEGSIIIKGGEKVKDTFNWIIFEQETDYNQNSEAIRNIINKALINLAKKEKSATGYFAKYFELDRIDNGDNIDIYVWAEYGTTDASKKEQSATSVPIKLTILLSNYSLIGMDVPKDDTNYMAYFSAIEDKLENIEYKNKDTLYGETYYNK